MKTSRILPTLLAICCVAALVSEAHAWRSDLYDTDWTPPETRSSAPSFENDKLIQDFSYAGYRRSEVELPNVTGPIFNVVEDYGADPSGDTDTTTQIQDAIDAAAEAGGGVVYLPAGTYRVRPRGSAAASLRIRSSNIVLRGAGPENTFIFNDAWQMRGTDIIRVDSPGSGWPTVPGDSPEASITSDLLSPSVEIPLDDVDGFSPGDWIVLRADATYDFKAEHNMADLWGDQGVGAGVLFIRQILEIDESTNTLTIDVPTRYYLKTRDDARVHLAGPHIDEVGLEDFSIGNIEHPNHGSSSGWGLSDYNQEGTNAYDVHGSYALRLTRLRNSWVRNVHTYRPPQNTLNAHVLSNALRIGNSVAVTVKDSHFQRALYAGGGGNAYMARITNAQEILLQNTVVGYNRHGFVFSHMQTSGNVIHQGRAEYTGWRAISGSAGSSGSDHHMYLSQSNLVDNTQLREDYFAAYYRHTWGSNHGQTAVHSVYWNLEGLAYYSGANYIVNTQQARYGYAIGTRGAANGISTAGSSSWTDQAHRTEPVDHVEGEGQGDTLEPRSLFDDQLRLRLTGESPSGRVSAPQLTPAGGTYYEPRQVTLESQTPGAQIHYTLNGTSPTADSPVYDGPLYLTEDTNIRAIAFADGHTESQVVAGNFSFPDARCLTIGDTWVNTPISNQAASDGSTGEFEFEFEATPEDAEMNAVMGLSYGDARRYQDLAAIVRFSPEGVIDARNGGVYEASSALSYQPSTTYFFRFVVNPAERNYNVHARPDGGDEVLIAVGFSFRTEQSQTFRLNRFSAFAGVGENRICDLIVLSDVVPEPDPDGDGGTGDGGTGDGGTGDGGTGDGTGDGGTGDGGTTPGPDQDPGESMPDAGDAEFSDDANLPSQGCACSSSPGPGGGFLFLVGVFALFCVRSRRSKR